MCKKFKNIQIENTFHCINCNHIYNDNLYKNFKNVIHNKKYTYSSKNHFVETLNKIIGIQYIHIPNKIYKEINNIIISKNIKDLNLFQLKYILKYNKNLKKYNSDIYYIYKILTNKNICVISNNDLKKIHNDFNIINEKFKIMKITNRIHSINVYFIIQKLLNKYNYNTDFLNIKLPKKNQELEYLWKKIKG